MTTNNGAVARGRALYANHGKRPSQIEAAETLEAEAQLAAADADLNQRAAETPPAPRSTDAGRAMYRATHTPKTSTNGKA